MAFMMTSEDYVSRLYKLALDRDADPGGLLAWSKAMEASGDPTLVLAGLIASDEYQERHGWNIDNDLKSQFLRAAASIELVIVDVGAQILAEQEHIYQPLLDSGVKCHVIGFDALAEKIEERKRLESGVSLTLLPYAIGDGDRHTLHINNYDATSSLFRLNENICRSFEHLHTIRTTSFREVHTHRLDDIIFHEKIDFLKLDVQGSELSVLKSSTRLLSTTAVIHCEVEFSQIYEGQPLFHHVAGFLDNAGFELIDIIVGHKYSYITKENTKRSSDRLIWADAVFFRKTSDRAVLISQAFTALMVYTKPTLALYLLERSKNT